MADIRGRDIAIIVGITVLLILVLAALGGGMMGWGMMEPWTTGWPIFGWWIAMVISMVLFWALIIGGIVWLVVWIVRQGRPAETDGPGRPRALDILQERYARGEITREQYEQMRRDIEER